MQIVAFHTTDEIYSLHARLFRKSLQRLGLAAHIVEIAPEEWLQAIAYKASFLHDMRDRYAGPLLYVDIDSFVHDLDLAYFREIPEDIAVHYHAEDGKVELLSGTIYLQDNPTTHALVEEWRGRTLLPENAGRFDQLILQEILEDWVGDGRIAVGHLPPEYCYIFDKFRKKYPDLEPSIEHLQASREVRYQSRNKSTLRRFLGLKAKASKGLLRRETRLGKLLKSVDLDES